MSFSIDFLKIRCQKLVTLMLPIFAKIKFDWIGKRNKEAIKNTLGEDIFFYSMVENMDLDSKHEYSY